jgi:hypothetical protein
MITFTAANLGWFIIILTICISMIAFMIGYIMGEKKESDRIIDYCIANSMNVTGEVIRDNYPMVYEQAQKVWISPTQLLQNRKGAKNG